MLRHLRYGYRTLPSLSPASTLAPSRIARFMSAPAAKRMKSTKVIGTHSGTFHCDEALAVFLLRQTDEFKDSDVVRTRDSAKLELLDIVVDVGGVYSPEKHRYDHHQRGFSEVFGYGGYDKIKLSSAGLVYKHFGRNVIAKLLNLSEDDPNVETLWLQMYSELIEGVDGIDNGVNLTKGPLAYSVRSDLGSRIKRLNPNWNEPATDAIFDERFAEASRITGEEFVQQLDYFAKAWLPARDVVKAGLDKRFDVDPSGQIVVFETGCPWKDHLFSLEATFQPPSQILYVLYPESDAPGSKWRIQCVPTNSESFENRKSMPEAWRGVRDAELSTVSGIDGCVFVHASGFTGGNETFDGALKMAQASLKA